MAGVRVRSRAVLRGALAGAWALSLMGATPAREEPAPSPDWDMVAFETNSWGSPVSSWRILANGGGSWTEQAEPGVNPRANVRMKWHEIAPDASNYSELEAILRALPSPAPDSAECSNFMTDGPYGTLRMTRGATTTEIAWNGGCMDEDYLTFLDVLKRADQHMAELGKAAPVTRIADPDGSNSTLP